MTTKNPFAYRNLLARCGLGLALAFGTLNLGFAQTAPATAPAAARLAFVSGSAQITKPDGTREPARAGASVAVGDTVATGASSQAQLKFTDNGLVALESNSEFKITSYQFNGRQDGSENLVFDFLKGALRTVSGFIGKQNKQAYRLRTPTATVGIRGTAGKITTDAQGTSIATSEGAFVLGNLNGTQFIEVPAGRVGFIGAGGGAPRLIAARPGIGDNSLAQLRDDFDFARQNRVFTSTERDALGKVVPVVNVGTVVVDGLGPYDNDNLFDYLTVYTQIGAPTNNASLGKIELDEKGDVYQIAITSNGQIASVYRGDATGPRSANAATVAESGKTEHALWGRWSNGVITVPNVAFPSVTTPVQVNLEGEQSYHYVLGTPATNVPTGGVLSYLPIGGTRPTSTDGNDIGTMNLRYFVADFGNRKVGMGFDVNMSEGTFKVDTTGNSRSPGQSEVVMRSGSASFLSNNVPTVFLPTSETGTQCAPYCATFIRGNFMGPGAAEAGFQYGIRTNAQSPTDTALTGTQVIGVGVVGKPSKPAASASPVSVQVSAPVPVSVPAAKP